MAADHYNYLFVYFQRQRAFTCTC